MVKDIGRVMFYMVCNILRVSEVSNVVIRRQALTYNRNWSQMKERHSTNKKREKL